MKTMQKIVALLLTFVLCLSTVGFVGAAETTEEATVPQSLKILAIGNSFSQDAQYYLWQIAKAAGIEEVIIGNAYRGGCTLEMHWTSVEASGTEYSYEKYTSATKVSTPGQTLESILKDEDWDIITLQQGSGSSGMPDTYEPYLTNLIDWINENKTNPDAKLYWHMTWAYQSDFNNSVFRNNYGKDQTTMYNAILSAKDTKVLAHDAFAGVIPSGTMIQNLRTSFLGDTITRDGYHMSYVIGRYAVGLMWFHTLTGLPIDDISVVPDFKDSADSTIYNDLVDKAVKDAVKKAAATPNAVTTSAYNDLKILAIGNSFSVDGMWWLKDVADDYGLQNVTLGIAYNGGCSLSEHMGYITNDSADYTYYKYLPTGTKWKTTAAQTLSTIIADEDWDIITLQQASGSSGRADTYEPYLTELITWVNENKTNAEAKLYWQTTWAYQSDYTSTNFSHYNNNQTTMYNAIISAKNEKVLVHDEFTGEIPTGTAIQNMRTSYLGDTVTRDGAHLSYVLGRGAAAMTWFRALTGLAIDRPQTEEDPSNGFIDTFAPDYDDASDATVFNDSHLSIVKESAYNAVATPNAVTASAHTEDPYATKVPTYEAGVPAIDLSNYDLIDYEPQGTSFYNSKTSSNKTESGDLAKKYISSKMFTKADLPVGTIIEVDEGYIYRPEGWTALDATNTDRPANVSTTRVIVDEAWWGDYNYRAFNITTSAGEDISSKVDEVASHFRIYVPKAADTTKAKIGINAVVLGDATVRVTAENLSGAAISGYVVLKQMTENGTSLKLTAVSLDADATQTIDIAGVKDAKIEVFVLQSFFTMQILSNVIKL